MPLLFKTIGIHIALLLYTLSYHSLTHANWIDYDEDNKLFATNDDLIEANRILDEEDDYRRREFKIYANLSMVGDIIIKGSGNLRSTLEDVEELGEEITLKQDINDTFRGASISLGIQHNLYKHKFLTTKHRTYLRYLTTFGETNTTMAFYKISAAHDYLITWDKNSLVMGAVLSRLNLQWQEDVTTNYSLESQSVGSNVLGVKIGLEHDLIKSNFGHTILEYGLQHHIVNHKLSFHREANTTFRTTELNTDLTLNNLTYFYIGISNIF